MKSYEDYKDNTNEDELARIERELQNKVLGFQTDNLPNEIEERRIRSESVENNLEAEAYTRQVLDLLDKWKTPKAKEAEPQGASPVAGYTQEELHRLAQESSSAFAPHTPKASPTLPQVKQQSSDDELSRTVALDPRKVGSEALLKDIAKSQVSSSLGIRDFYHQVYSSHGETRLREKEAYLNFAHTGSVAAAREKLDRFAIRNGFNTASLDTLNDGLVSAMHDLHREELERTPKGKQREDMELRHSVEKALFAFREHEDKHGQEPSQAQARKDAYRDLQKAHIAYAENRWGRPLAHKDVPNVNDEVERFDMKATLKPENKPTDLQQYMEAKSKLGMKISKFR